MGLPAFILQKVVQPLYFAREDTKRPFYYAFLAMLVNAGFAIGLSAIIGFIAAAIATTLAAWVMLALLWTGTRDMGDAARFDTRARSRIKRIVVASLLMGVVLWIVQGAMGGVFVTPGIKIPMVLLLCLIGGGAYAAFGTMVGAFRLSEVKAALRRRG